VVPASVAASLPLDGHDLAVGSLGYAVGNPVATEGQDVFQMSLNHLPYLAHRGQVRLAHPHQPPLHETPSPARTEILTNVVGTLLQLGIFQQNFNYIHARKIFAAFLDPNHVVLQSHTEWLRFSLPTATSLNDLSIVSSSSGDWRRAYEKLARRFMEMLYLVFAFIWLQ
jgi:hypothetical protein